ncbi:acyltransferase [Glaciihabitans sp. dw_435]|uniref:acyltransferase family protein n=1 Tax=Glaciihabitans sp. dw_435 TaxID=2720081 RepID=UPI001BD2B27B|nr:acyltransferase [Glaciihabitans sp. dw_435]
MEPTRERFASLDGLRGVAAVIVVVFHVVASDTRAGAIYTLTNREPLTSIEWLFNYTPLRILWSGSEAVVLFYVLSGFVLALPFARGRTQQWRYFYPRRLLRLYIPAIASLIFAWLTTLVIHRAVIPGGSPWLNVHAEEAHGPLQVVLGSSLMAGWGSLNTSLWSLRWEVIFSLLLPVFLYLASRLSRALWLKVAVVIAFCALWPVFGFFYGDLVYIAVFALGVLLAYNVERIRVVAARIPTAAWWIALVAAIALITNSWLVAGADPYSRVRLAWIGIAAVGSVMVVIIVAFWPPAKRLFESRPVRWLGMISFSLYLTQEPIVVGLSFLTRGSWPLWIELPLALALSLLVGWLFYRYVEKPSHVFSRNFLRARQERGSAIASPTPARQQ